MTDKEKKEPGGGASLLSQNVYCVCFPQRDSLEVLQGELAAARRRFFTSGKKAVKMGRHEVVKGFDGDLRGKLSRWGFYWKKTALGVSGQKGVALEEAFDQKNGYVLVNRDFRGVIVSRVFFNKEHAWQKSEYYEPWDPSTAKVMFKPDPMENTIERYDWDPDKKLYRSVVLHSAPYQAGSAEQALVNARFGEPPLIASLESGQVCYCPQQEAEGRTQALEEISSGTMVLMPAWEIKEGALPVEEGEEETAVTFTSLEEYARIEAPEKPASPPPPIEAQARDVSEEETPALLPEEPMQADELDLEFILADARQADAEEAPMPAQEEPKPEDPVPVLEETAPPVWEEAAQAVFSEPQPPEEPLPAKADSAIILPVVREAMEQQAEAAQEEHPFFQQEEPEPAPEGLPKRAAPPDSAFGAWQEEPPAPSMSLEDTSILSAARQAGSGNPPKRRAGASQPRPSGPRQGAHSAPSMSLEDTSILSAARQAGSGNPPKRAQQPERPQPSMSLEDTAILSAARQAGNGEPPKRAQQAGRPQPSMSLEDTSILSAARQAGNGEPPRRLGTPEAPGSRLPQGRARHKGGPAFPRHAGASGQPPIPPAPSAPPAQRYNPPAPAGPSGSDMMRAGKLTGKGRAEQPGGLTAYEGEYKDGKRQGFGSHYYKSGDLSYAGFWRDDKKDGLGVSFREGDHALHISRWEQGMPGQQVSLFDREGSLRYGGRIVNGKKDGAGVSISSADGSVLVTKWQDGQNTGLASAFDPDGNLLYYGSWKNGKRHGHGTEFDKNGGIVFDGEWRDDQYYNGILYQKPGESSLPAGPEYGEPDWEL